MSMNFCMSQTTYDELMKRLNGVEIDRSVLSASDIMTITICTCFTLYNSEKINDVIKKFFEYVKDSPVYSSTIQKYRLDKFIDEKCIKNKEFFEEEKFGLFGRKSRAIKKTVPNQNFEPLQKIIDEGFITVDRRVTSNPRPSNFTDCVYEENDYKLVILTSNNDIYEISYYAGFSSQSNPLGKGVENIPQNWGGIENISGPYNIHPTFSAHVAFVMGILDPEGIYFNMAQ